MVFQRSSLLAKMLGLYLFSTLARNASSAQTLPENSTMSPLSVFNGTAPQSAGLPRPDLYLISGFGLMILTLGVAYAAGYSNDIGAYCSRCWRRPTTEALTPSDLEQPWNDASDSGSERSMRTA
jgi:hypothetical protein